MGPVNGSTVDSKTGQGLYYYGSGIGSVDTSYGILMVIKAGDYTIQIAWSMYLNFALLRSKALAGWSGWKKITTTAV